MTYTTHGNARSLTHRARPGIEPATSWFLVGLVNHCATTGTPGAQLFIKKLFFYLFVFFRAAPAVYGGSLARGPAAAEAYTLPLHDALAISEPRLRPTPQLTATPDP